MTDNNSLPQQDVSSETSEDSLDFVPLDEMNQATPGITGKMRKIIRDPAHLLWEEYMDINIEDLHNDVRINGCGRRQEGTSGSPLEPKLCKYCATIFDNWEKVLKWFAAKERFLVSPYHVNATSMIRDNDCLICNKFLAMNYGEFSATCGSYGAHDDEHGEMTLYKPTYSSASFELKVHFRTPFREAIIDVNDDVKGDDIDKILETDSDNHALRLGCLSRSTQLVYHWMQTCRLSHASCQRSTKRLPTRLIKIDRTVARLSARLYITKPSDHFRYTTLSHCWGGLVFLRLLITNYAQLLSGITISELSKTFRDALEISRELGFEYLWIDSLCIIQDSVEDWEHEASCMADVYGSADLNIAATAAVNGTEGCMRNGNLTYTVPTHIKVRPDHDGGTKTLVLSDRDIYSRTIDTAPLALRAWCLQERLLSVRTLHFAKMQLFWECDEMFACETYPLGQSSSNRGRMRENMKPTAELWESIVGTYTSTDLSFTSDKIVALAGIARKFSKNINQRYMMGLWQDWICDHLMWSLKYPERVRERSVPRDGTVFPSWSWVSVHASISFDMYEPVALARRYIRFAGMHVQLQAEDPFGDAKHARLELHVRYVLEAQVTTLARFVENGKVSVQIQHRLYPVDVTPDIPLEWEGLTELFIIPIWRKVRKMNGRTNDWVDHAALACKRIETQRGCFRRIGTCRALNQHEFWLKESHPHDVFDRPEDLIHPPANDNYLSKSTDEQGNDWYRVMLE